jgi:hypothetical protein
MLSAKIKYEKFKKLYYNIFRIKLKRSISIRTQKIDLFNYRIGLRLTAAVKPENRD